MCLNIEIIKSNKKIKKEILPPKKKKRNNFRVNKSKVPKHTGGVNKEK